MRNREFDKREFTPEEKRVLDIIETQLGHKYLGNLWVRRTVDPFTRKPEGYQLEMSLNNLDKPYYITFMGDDIEKFYELVAMQLREDNIPSRVEYTYGQYVDPTRPC